MKLAKKWVFVRAEVMVRGWDEYLGTQLGTLLDNSLEMEWGSHLGGSKDDE
jgi:hypothetical protein